MTTAAEILGTVREHYDEWRDGEPDVRFFERVVEREHPNATEAAIDEAWMGWNYQVVASRGVI